MKSPLLASLLLVNFYLDASAESEKDQPVAAKKQKVGKRILTKKAKSPNTMVILTLANLKETLTQPLTIVMVGADWCVHCRKMSPLFENSHQEVQDKATYTYLSLGDHFGDKASLISQLQREYSICAINLIPSFLVFKEGKFVEHVEGSQTKEQLAALVKKYTEKEFKVPESQPVSKTVAKQITA